jgi:hypothetical protein
VLLNFLTIVFNLSFEFCKHRLWFWKNTKFDAFSISRFVLILKCFSNTFPRFIFPLFYLFVVVFVNIAIK